MSDILTETLAKNAPLRTFYGVMLSERRSIARFQLYEVVDGALRAVLPADRHMCSRATMLPYQVFSMREGYPAFHFRIDNPSALWRERFVEILNGTLGYRVSVKWLNGEDPHA